MFERLWFEHGKKVGGAESHTSFAGLVFKDSVPFAVRWAVQNLELPLSSPESPWSGQTRAARGRGVEGKEKRTFKRTLCVAISFL